MRAVSDTPLVSDVPLLDDLMPWSVPPLRLGRAWVVAPDARTLRARWDALVRAEGAERERLFRPTRARGVRTGVGALPGQATGTVRLAREAGPCPEPVRVLHEPFDEQWLLPDHRLIDSARPELWRIADARQLFVLELGHVHQAGRAPGPALLASAVLPEGRSPGGRPGRIRPLYRRPDGAEPNLAPGLLPLLSGRYGCEVAPEDVPAWALAAGRPAPGGCRVPLPASGERWRAGVELGHRLLAAQLRGAHGAQAPRLPGGRRPYVRAALPAWPAGPAYDPDAEALVLDGGRIAPVPAAAWEFEVSGVRVLERWFERRGAHREAEGLEGIGPAVWPQEWTSELLALITVLALLAEAEPERAALAAALDADPGPGAGELRAAGVLPVPASARRPASVLDHQEEGPDGQFALL
ncbi:type ISP restriction/modification enzyme [Streptomyces sp. NPDC093225]|uniref:type ISP restriction/modification enzyme n=1 Tax=Streptomyces sp. NPDC093225 TaxID=3366034 RepID=UPI00382079AC